MKNHLTGDELVDLLYAGGPNAHLEECGDCAERLGQLREQRALAAGPLRVSHEFLAAQRRNIYARMGERPQQRTRWVPAMAAVVCLIAAGLFSHHPAPVAKADAIDPQLFADVYSMEQSMEPIAAQPINDLFEQEQP